MTIEEFKKDTIKAYDEHVIDCMNESGILRIDEYIESFINYVDSNLRTSGEDLEELQQLFNTEDITEICEHIEKILQDYEKGM